MLKETFSNQTSPQNSLFAFQEQARALLDQGLDFPTSRDEKWKYTRIAPIVDADYTIHPPVFPVGERSDEHVIQMINGIPEDAVKLNDGSGLEVRPFRDLVAAAPALLNSLFDPSASAFFALNCGYFTDGVQVTIRSNTNLSQPIELIHQAKGIHQASNVRVLIIAERGSKASISMRFSGHENDFSFTNSLAEVVIEEGAELEICLIENEGMTSSMVNSIFIRQASHSKLNMITISEHAKLVRNNLHVAIAGEGCETSLSGLYFTNGDQHIDNQCHVDHLKPNCLSHQLYKGVMDGKSTGVFNGKIYVHPQAQKTNAFQSNKNVLLSDTSSVNAKPELEIYADDVKCSHGCTVGELDEEAMFYMRSRGLDQMEARKLLLQAFASDVLEKVSNESLRQQVSNSLFERFQFTHS